ncbi:hypothetical protein MPLB_1490051 [Mesorhizobium sp. ORS 3324]|nr:hypothetical protein MPLB_1490051 [Mesorhizobium sp. ORS 3324]
MQVCSWPGEFEASFEVMRPVPLNAVVATGERDRQSSSIVE